MADLEQLLVDPNSSIRDAMACMDRGGKGIILVVDSEQHLLGIVTDGDMRRAILHNTDFDKPIEVVMNRNPLVAPPGRSAQELLRLMDEGKGQFIVNQLPIVDEEGQVVELVLRSDLVTQRRLSIPAVIMAGGYGTRLRPLTDETAKPMLDVNGRPVVEWVVESLQQAGIRNVIIATHYRAESIRQHFGDGQDFGVHIDYIHEEKPSGTAGPLALLNPWSQPLLVVNGDILTLVDYQAMLRYHKRHKAEMTVGVREYHLQVPYGVVEVDDVKIQRLTEKPTLRYLVNAGIYLLEPSVRNYIPQGDFSDMTDVTSHLLADGRSVVAFPVCEYWIDIGEHNDYAQAQQDMRNRGSKE